MCKHREQGRIEPSRRVAGRGRHELVVEAELVEEGAQPRVIVLGETWMRAEWVRHLGKRPADMLFQHRFVGYVVGDLAQSVHVV